MKLRLTISILVFTLLYVMLTLSAHADPAIQIGPQGQVTVIYPAQNSAPTIAIAPNGGITQVYPSTPIVPVPQAYTPPPMPAYLPPPPSLQPFADMPSMGMP